MPRDCRYAVRVEADTRDFTVLFEEAKKLAGTSDRYVEVHDGFMSFHFESKKAQSDFLAFVEQRKMNARFQR